MLNFIATKLNWFTVLIEFNSQIILTAKKELLLNLNVRLRNNNFHRYN